MASNFRISTNRRRETLVLKLAGDFDGTSADELLHSLGRDTKGVKRVLIDTKGIKRVFEFGRNTFEKNLYRLKTRSLQLVFTGHKAGEIVPENNRFCQCFCPE